MSNQQQFQKTFEKGNHLAAAQMLFNVYDKNLIALELVELMKSTKFRCYTHFIRHLEASVREYSNGTISKLDMEVLQTSLRNNSHQTAQFVGCLILKAQSTADPHYYLIALTHIAASARVAGSVFVKQFVARLASKVWPEKGLLGALYG